MARRESKLEDVIVDTWGSLVLAKRDDKTGMYVCPLCEAYWTAQEEDLIAHLASHARGYLERLKPAPRE